jgi:hypothetical protein
MLRRQIEESQELFGKIVAAVKLGNYGTRANAGSDPCALSHLI